MSSSQTIQDVLGGYKKYRGFVYGVEIEAEGHGLPERETIYDEDGDEIIDHVDPDLGAWLTHEEGSISGAEYVMSQPLPVEQTLEEIDMLFERLADVYGATLTTSPRTSIHVHVNCSDRSIDWLRKALPVLAAAEPFLIHHSGRHRKGNLFCLSRREAPFGWTPIINAASSCTPQQYDTKYMAVNFVPLWSSGSIEFRMMRGLTTAKQVRTWVSLISLLMEAVDLIPDNHDWQHFPIELCFLMSNHGLAEMSARASDRLEKQALQSAQEVIAALALTKPRERPYRKSLYSLEEAVMEQAISPAPPPGMGAWSLSQFQQVFPAPSNNPFEHTWVDEFVSAQPNTASN